MNLNYNEIKFEEFPNFKGGEKILFAKMFHDEKNRIIYGKLEPGASIGVHTHETNSEIIYIYRRNRKNSYGRSIRKAGSRNVSLLS